MNICSVYHVATARHSAGVFIYLIINLSACCLSASPSVWLTVCLSVNTTCKYYRLAIYRGTIKHDAAPRTTISQVKTSAILRPKRHSYLGLVGDLWTSFMGYLEKNDSELSGAHYAMTDSYNATGYRIYENMYRYNNDIITRYWISWWLVLGDSLLYHNIPFWYRSIAHAYWSNLKLTFSLDTHGWPRFPMVSKENV